MRSERLEAGGRQIHVRRWGPDDGRPLLFLHSLGSAASGALLGPGIEPLVAAGWSIAAPDQPGFGQTPAIEPDGYAIPRLAELAWDVADALGWRDLVLAGHSWGGSVAVHATALRPERVKALVLVDSGHLDYGDQPGAGIDKSLETLSDEAEEGRARVPDRAAVATELELDIDDPVVAAYMEGLMDDDAGGLVSRTLGPSGGAARYHLMRASQSDQWAAIAAAKTPTLLLLATVPDDLRATNEGGAERLRAAVPQADIRFIAGATHSLITDQRHEFGRMVAEWLARLD